MTARRCSVTGFQWRWLGIRPPDLFRHCDRVPVVSYVNDLAVLDSGHLTVHAIEAFSSSRKPKVLSLDGPRDSPHVDNILSLHDEFFHKNMKVGRCFDPPFSELPNSLPSLSWREGDVMIHCILCHHREYAVDALSVPSFQLFHHDAQVLSFLRTKIGKGRRIAVEQILFCHVLRVREQVVKRLFESRVVSVTRSL